MSSVTVAHRPAPLQPSKKGLSDAKVIERSREFGKADPSWHGPGPVGLRHFRAAYDPNAVLGQAFYR